MLLSPKLMVIAIAIVMGVGSAAIFRKQAKATTCPVHNRHAGTVAILIGWMLAITALGLLSYAVFFLFSL